jgi:hypothetical protein
MAKIVYRAGSDSDDNLTPRPEQDEKTQPGQSPGISVFEKIELAVEPGGKAQGIDIDQLCQPLMAIPDNPDEAGGIAGHFSIAPVKLDGRVDSELLREWASTRKTGRVHWLTVLLRDAIVKTPFRRPR